MLNRRGLASLFSIGYIVLVSYKLIINLIILFGFHLLLNGNELLVQKKQLVNSVLAVDARIPIPVFLPGVTAADAKAKCSAGGVIDLPGMDEALAKTKSFMPNP